MKLFSKKRLQINTIDSKTIIRWWVLSLVDLFLIFMLLITFISGIGSLIQVEEVLGVVVIPLGTTATTMFWIVWSLLVLHIIFNRSVKLEISPEELIYKKRFILGVFRKIKMEDISHVLITEKIDHISESPPDGRDLTTFELIICIKSKKRTRIKGLSKPDAELIQKTIKDYNKT